MEHDRLGRRRTADQGQGLRSLHPLLPVRWSSKAIRVAMSEADWERLEEFVRETEALNPAPTQARALGQALARLMDDASGGKPAPAPLDWLDWERQKTLRLLRSAV